MTAHFHFEHSVAFSPESAAATLRAIPALPGVFALHGTRVEGQPEAQPYLTRTADLRRRIARILALPTPSAKGNQPVAKGNQPAARENHPSAEGSQSPADSSPVQSRRLNLRSRIARIDYTVTGSEFESTLTLYYAGATLYGPAEVRRRLRLRTPFFLRFTAENAFPRVYSTNRLGKHSLANLYGPFASRAAADRYCEAVLDLFKLRRCSENLSPRPDHPGCVYGEMNKCLAPCNQACTPEGVAAYAAEAAAVQAFFDTHGESLLTQLTADRERASSGLDFERAAQLHAQIQRVKAAAALADPLIRPIPRLRAVIIQRAAAVATASSPSPRDVADGSASVDIADGPVAAIFLFHSGCIAGPARLSTLGVRAVREQSSVGTSLFAQPLMLQAVPLADEAQPGGVTPAEPPEARAASLIAALEERPSAPTDLATLSDHLSLLRRWYYRPEKQRTGEVFLPKNDGTWPIRRILNAAARAALGEPAAEAERKPQPMPG